MIQKIDFKDLLKEVMFDRKNLFKNIFLMFISVSLVALFPVVTQFYIRIAYHRSALFLLLSTVIIVLIYIIKLFIDMRVLKFENKFYIKLKSNIQEKLIKKFIRNRYHFDRMYGLAEKKTSLYVLFVRKVLVNNFKSVVKIIVVFITILVFDKSLFVYSLFFLPVFVIYLVLFRSLFERNREKVQGLMKKTGSLDVVSFLESDLSRKRKDEDFGNLFRKYKQLQSLLVEKDIRNRNSLVSLNQILRMSITIFRVIYLAYFGYFIISQDIHISGLIVGLLFITILIGSFISILESVLFYYISRDAVIKLQKMC